MTEEMHFLINMGVFRYHSPIFYQYLIRTTKTRDNQQKTVSQGTFKFLQEDFIDAEVFFAILTHNR